MKRSTPKLVWFAGACVLAFLVAGPLARAASDKSKSGDGNSEKRKHNDETLQRYDRNANGKLDPDEEAARKADQERAKQQKKKG